tara:strand:+ start:51 stop:1046 length:996 start_codon:yes stop_codon:yes gene_type:complete
MGIKSLTQLIKKTSPAGIQHVGLYTFKDKRVAIDTSIFLYKSLMNVRYKGDYLRNKEGKVVSHIQGIYTKTIQYLSMGITPIYIFDGKPPTEKSHCIQERNKKAQVCKAKMELTESKEEKQSLEKGTIRMTKEYIDDLKHLFTLMGVSYIHPDGEAEAYAAELCRIGYVDAVITEDMDTLAYGCPTLIRNCIDKQLKRPDIITVFSMDKILSDFEMNMNQFVDMCILCGCDYCPTIPKIGSVRAYQQIKEHESIEKFIEASKCEITEEFKGKYVPARNIFNIFRDKINVNTMQIYSSNYDSAALYAYLVHGCSMSEKRVQNALKKIAQANK